MLLGWYNNSGIVMKKEKKSQISIDFMIVFAVLMIVFLFVFGISTSRTNELYGSQKFLNAKEIADSAAFYINSVFLAGHGTTKSFYIPEGLRDETQYALKIYPAARIVEIQWEGRHYSAPIVSSAVSGVLNIPYGEVNLKNDFDEVIVG